jgi:hypothetical protein
VDNTKTHFECEVKSMSSYEIKVAIANYFDMEYPDNSDIPQEMLEIQSEKCIFIGTKKSEIFDIFNYKLENGKYTLLWSESKIRYDKIRRIHSY